MIPTDAECVGLMRKLYAPQPGDFDHIEDPGQDHGVCWAIKHYDACVALVFRGSMTKEDWFRNLLSEMGSRRFNDVFQVGSMPYGFSLGLDTALQNWNGLCLKPIVFVGHSLGAARAVESAGMAMEAYKTIAKIVLCGCPRPGTGTLVARLADEDIRSYRNLADPVCDVPTDPPWAHVRPFIALSEQPLAGDISIFRDHSIQLYEAGVTRRGA